MTEESEKRNIRIFALILVLSGLVLNERLLGYFLAVDQHIESQFKLWTIYICRTLAVSVGMLFIIKPMYLLTAAKRSFLIVQEICELFFSSPRKDLRARTFTAFAAALLLVIGASHWALFLRGLTFSAYDWKNQIKYYTVLRESVEGYVIPFHVSEPLQRRDRFLANPETLLSPQILLLRWMQTATFVTFNTVMLYTVGFMGCVLIKRRYKLSLFSFSILYVLFSFNGYITSHIAVGHYAWTAYFLLPLFCLLVLQTVEEKPSIERAIMLALVLFAITLQGGVHFYVWCLIFLLFLAAGRRHYFRHVVAVIGFSALLSAFRLVPAFVTFAGRRSDFVSGYPTVQHLIESLIVIREHNFEVVEGVFGTLGWWEYDAYISLVGLGLIVCFGIYLRFRAKTLLAPYKYEPLDVPLLGMTILSISYFYAIVALLPIPVVNSERVSSRFVIMPLLMLVVISCIRMQNTIGELKGKGKLKVLALASLCYLFFSLVSHSYLWRVERIEQSLGAVGVDVRIHTISKPDIVYKLSVILGGIVSLVALIGLLGTLLLKRLRARDDHSIPLQK